MEGAVGHCSELHSWSFVMLAVLLSATAHANATCRVLDPELQGRYEGGCVDGLAHGEGVAEGSARYSGGFVAGKKHGRGVKTWPSGDRYEGGFADDRRHGVGIYRWGEGSSWSGERYQGGYERDLRSGFGVYEWPNGDRYVGQWRDDAMVGQLPPMLQQRLRHEQALTAAMEKAGTRVCRIAAPGKTAVFTARGEVQSLSGKRLTVRLTDSVDAIAGRRTAQSGELVTEAIENWRPCY
jgi:hypothetical protein